jgi:HAD superfamily hydrolase (TIGR01549 family)
MLPFVLKGFCGKLQSLSNAGQRHSVRRTRRRRFMPRYRAVLFDLFDTVALYDREKLPLVTVDGRTKRKTTPALRESFERAAAGIPFDRFVTAFSDVSHEQQDAFAHDLREVPCATRFERTLVRAGLPASAGTNRLAAELAAIHSSLIGTAAEVPAAHARFLRRVAAGRPIALVSNFDDGVVGRQILERGGVLDLFRVVTISVDHGWRKPDVRIFADTLDQLGVAPADALFVGDSPGHDVAGAKAAGMDVAWVNAREMAFPAGLSPPDYVVPDIPALARLLEIEADAR